MLWANLQYKICYGYNCSPSHLKLFCEQIALPIIILVNKAIGVRTARDEMKIAKIIPVYTSDTIYNLSNYKPISLLPSIS